MSGFQYISFCSIVIVPTLTTLAKFPFVRSTASHNNAKVSFQRTKKLCSNICNYSVANWPSLSSNGFFLVALYLFLAWARNTRRTVIRISISNCFHIRSFKNSYSLCWDVFGPQWKLKAQQELLRYKGNTNNPLNMITMIGSYYNFLKKKRRKWKPIEKRKLRT